MSDDILDRLYELQEQVPLDPDADLVINDAMLEIENLRHKISDLTIDIVVRLRTETDDLRAMELCLQAADEIERLRNELKGTQK